MTKRIDNIKSKMKKDGLCDNCIKILTNRIMEKTEKANRILMISLLLMFLGMIGMTFVGG